MAPKISVIIPVYNRAHTIRRAVESVLAQSHTDYELIVVDDGSTDNTRGVLEAYKSRVTYVYQENRERSAARNNGLRHASGKYVVFLDSDDWLLPTMLSVQSAYLDRHAHVGFVYGYGVMAGLDGRVVEPPVLMGAPLHPSRPAFVSLILESPVLIVTAMVRRDSLDRVGYFDKTLAGTEDWDLWLRLSVHYAVGFTHQPVAVCSVPVPFFPARLDKYGMHEQTLRVLQGLFDRLPPGSPLLDVKPRAIARAHVQWGACLDHALGRNGRARQHIQQALSVYPSLAPDIEIVPKSVVRFATWYQNDGTAFIRSFFLALLPLVEWKKLERSALALYHARMGHLTAQQRRYSTAFRHLVKAAITEPTAFMWACRQYGQRLGAKRMLQG